MDRTDHVEQAEDFFRKALEANRRLKQFDAAAALNFASFLKEQGRAEDARHILDEATQRAPSYGPAHLERARLLRSENEYEQAAEEAELALKLEGCGPSDVRAAHVLLAMVYSVLGNKQAAEEHRRLAKSP